MTEGRGKKTKFEMTSYEPGFIIHVGIFLLLETQNNV